jgi:hypothetical protein
MRCVYVEGKALLNLGNLKKLWLGISLFFLSACFNEKSLVGNQTTTSTATSTNFQGCLSVTAASTTSMSVAYEFPAGASKVSVLRNGTVFFSSQNGESGTVLDTGLLEGRSY